MAANDSSLAAGALGSSLLEGLRNRREEAWKRFLDLYGPLVYSWCRSRWRLRPEAAADVLQDVAKRVLESIADYDGGNFVAWLQKVTQTQAVNHLRRNPILVKLPDDPADDAKRPPSPAESGPEQLSGVLGRVVEKVRSRCDSGTWKAFWEVVVKGRTPADVARDLGVPANTVYLARCRILYRIRKELGEFPSEGPR
jgi:RNA polymerase sigma-70 factor (ECF subfamily)